MKNLKFFISTILIAFIFSSCYKDVDRTDSISGELQAIAGQNWKTSFNPTTGEKIFIPAMSHLEGNIDNLNAIDGELSTLGVESIAYNPQVDAMSIFVVITIMDIDGNGFKAEGITYMGDNGSCRGKFNIVSGYGDWVDVAGSISTTGLLTNNCDHVSFGVEGSVVM